MASNIKDTLPSILMEGLSYLLVSLGSTLRNEKSMTSKDDVLAQRIGSLEQRIKVLEDKTHESAS